MSATTTVRVTVRYFAAARAASGVEEEPLELAAGTTVAALTGILGARDAELARVLARCSYLVDGIAVRDQTIGLQNAQTVDVLPPFAGG
ncbi:MoaD/ThiS family protein [Mycobacterium manitobense]|uniref:Molybdopterin synthase sulfur carrier subunit n=1 Tax=[Mycobacterium] manitobense TaxID=190147 RepID=A0A9X3BXU1_9MYCO|nr:MoaD/ThiS family protein [[Mycobacterium] manitobense]MCV7172876.1 MoaD/ThiS family protein [[Mycobacterium] manitobense]